MSLPKTKTIREQFEELEEKTLSKFASKSRESRGRKIEEDKCPLRTDFQRDRDRILYSGAFRRLKHKTQVFFSPDDDNYRTRMTHTLEVSQVSRTIAKALRLNEELTEAIALGHDIGHTPFGHSGETVLNEIMEGGYRHNEQSVRVAEVIENLNLTKETLNGIVCHSYALEPAFTLEGQIVQLADKIAYINHDIDDAIRARVIRQEDLPKDSIEYFSGDKNVRFTKMIYDIVQTSYDQPFVRMSEECFAHMKILRSWMFENVYLGSAAKHEEDKAMNIIRTLFEYYYNDLKKKYPASTEKALKRTVCDYISGMTDRYAIVKFKELFLMTPLEYVKTDTFLNRMALINGLAV
ncbi:MAG: deoxyguanosinetriphosphate triphosphohydrolase [Candidatus Gastranaerophilales bacterium]|nr:deoxyguanosinetriphosphate triphosphohydrolase [Candidatus Gastranaerophilales bacterium]